MKITRQFATDCGFKQSETSHNIYEMSRSCDEYIELLFEKEEFVRFRMNDVNREVEIYNNADDVDVDYFLRMFLMIYGVPTFEPFCSAMKKMYHIVQEYPS